jgi:hypothetical protein
MRVYFTHYGRVWSYSIYDAITLCQMAIAADGAHEHKDDDLLRARVSSRHGASPRIRGRYVHKCLDWGKEEWAYLLGQLMETKKEAL